MRRLARPVSVCCLVASLACLLTTVALAARAPDPIRPRVLVLNYDPIIEAEGGRRLHAVCGWRDPRELVRNHIADLADASHGLLQCHVAQWVDVDEFPVKEDGFRYTDASYLACFRHQQEWHQPDAIDYAALLRQFRIPDLVARREIDEVWLMAMPYAGCWESTMGGRGAYWCNSDPIPGVDCPRLFIVMGFNYERGEAEMIHDWGHRTESILSHVYGGWDRKAGKTAWTRFSLVAKDAPPGTPAGLGKTHFPPNGIKDYDYDNPAPVLSTADDWLSYPRLRGITQTVNRDTWADVTFPASDKRTGKVDYQRGFLKWWFRHLPHASGRALHGKLANWWAYVADFNRSPESRGTPEARH